MALGIEGPPASYKQIKEQCPSDYFASLPPPAGFCLFHLDTCVECPSLSRFRLGSKRSREARLGLFIPDKEPPVLPLRSPNPSPPPPPPPL